MKTYKVGDVITINTNTSPTKTEKQIQTPLNNIF